MEHGTLIGFYLVILKLTLQCLFGKKTFLLLGFLQCQTYLGTGTRGLYDIQPLLTGLLLGRRQNLHLIATLQLLTDTHHLAIDTAARTLITQLRVDMVSKVEHGSTYRELIQIAMRREHKHLVFIEIHLKLVHRLQTLRVLQHRTNIGKPLVKTRLALDALIAPVGCHASFGNLVHTLRTNLHLYPLLLRTQHRNMQTLVTIRLRH